MIRPIPISFGTLTMPATITRKNKKPIEQPIAPPPPRIDPANQLEADWEATNEKNRALDFASKAEKSKAKKASHGPLPEALNNTTTPAGIAANDPEAGTGDYRWQEEPGGTIHHHAVETLARHPDNREPTEQDVLAMVQGFTERGQLDPIVVWPPPKSWPQYEAGKLIIISGETRWLAAKMLGWTTIQGRVAEGLSPAEALELLADFNGARKDLNPIQKAKLVQRLCTPVEEGGAGLTRQKAAERVGVDTGATASNLVRLLELPQKWQDRVASGELAWTWAREILPYSKLPPVMEHLEGAWKDQGKRGGRYNGDTFDSRQNMQQSMETLMHNFCRRIDEPHWTGSENRKLKADLDKPEIREQLGIVEFQLSEDGKKGTKTVLVATNDDAFDEMLRKQGQRATKAAAEKAGRDETPAKAELSPYEKKRRADQRFKQRQELIENWRQQLLRRELICTLDDERDDGFRLVLAYAARPTHHRRTSIADLLKKASGKPGRKAHWDCVADQDAELLTRKIAKLLLAEEPTEWRDPILPHELVEAYAGDLSVNVNAAWLALQIPGGGNTLAGEDLLEEFFLLHQTDELRELAKELGKHVPDTASKAQAIKLLLGVPRGTNQRLPLPKSIKPVSGVGKAQGKTKKGAK